MATPPVSPARSRAIQQQPPATPPKASLKNGVLVSSSPPKTPAVVLTRAAAKLLATPEFQQLATPDGSHRFTAYEASPSQLSGQPKRTITRMFKQLKRKGLQTLASPTQMKKDTQIIKQEKIQPDEKERIVIESPDSGRRRAYKRHKRPNPNGVNRLFPVTLSPTMPGRDPTVVTLSNGKDVLDLRDQWRNGASRSMRFKTFVLSQVTPLPVSQAPNDPVPSLIKPDQSAFQQQQ